MSDRAVKNAKISQAGLFYCGHTRELYASIELSGRGWGCTTRIPLSKVGELLEMLDGELGGQVEDGVYLESLKGKPVKVVFDSESLVSSKAIGIGDILCDEDEMLMFEA